MRPWVHSRCTDRASLCINPIFIVSRTSEHPAIVSVYEGAGAAGVFRVNSPVETPKSIQGDEDGHN